MVLNKYLCFSYLIFSWMIAFTLACNLALLNEQMTKEIFSFPLQVLKEMGPMEAAEP